MRTSTSLIYVSKYLRNPTADITVLTRAESVEIFTPEAANAKPAIKSLAGVSGELQVVLPIEGLVNLEALRGRLQKDIGKAEKDIQGLSARLNNAKFTEKAPPEVVDECKAKFLEAQAQAELARTRLIDLL